ncbi:MAG: ammonium transporter [Pseudomonadota bacterium]
MGRRSSGAVTPMVNQGDTSFVIFSLALVMLMTPGLALFYGGMVRGQNVLATIMHSFTLLGLISLQWALFGYSLAFGPDHWGLIGDFFSWFGLAGVGAAPNPDYAATIPHQAFMLFQMMFAVITPALICGAYAERMKFPAFILFSLLWSTLIYDPLCHWVWGCGGWMRNLGVLDFAGGVVVHISSGASALACAMFLGPRRGYRKSPFLPHNLPMTILGAGLLWFGWFGFNAGSALAAGGLAVSAATVTHLASAAGAVAWMSAEWFHQGKPTTLGLVSGAVAGLATITPASGFVGPMAAILIGLVAGALCYWGVSLKWKFGYDDSLDVVGVHGLGSTWGVLAVGLFASQAINPAGADGLLHGGGSLLAAQALAVVVAWVLGFGGSWLLLLLVDSLVGLRVSAQEEMEGLDLSLHGETGYTGTGGGSFAPASDMGQSGGIAARPALDSHGH